MTYDVVIVGGGIVGLATAWQLSRDPSPRGRIVVLEKEASPGEHQTGHNSGVLHSGIYYKPGSLRAINCRLGKVAMERFCAEQGVEYDRCGKVIVAVDESELPNLERILERGRANGIRCEPIGPERLAEIEPHAAGVRAIHVPEAGIVNYRQVCLKLAELVRTAGGEIITGARVTALDARSRCVVAESTAGSFEGRRLVNCAGLHSDRVAAMSGITPPAQIVPFRGEYYELLPGARHLCRNLIYPVPDPAFPFLGVHFTRMIGGHVECGPNAVLALAREGYDWSRINVGDLVETLSYPGFVHMALRHWRQGLDEMWRSLSKSAFVAALQRLVPAIRGEDLLPAPAGVRAMALASDGQLIDDFLIETTGRVVNVLNAPSPAATSSLNIGRMIVERLGAME
jgi:L-2-hydroxyglutarate oxidase